MTNLHASIYAPTSSRPFIISQQKPTTPQERRAIARLQELDRFRKLQVRLRWKSHHLIVSQQQVLTHHNTQAADMYRFTSDANEAETMFKIDFFEFYVLLERVLVHLLAALEIGVSAQQQHEGESFLYVSDRWNQYRRAPYPGIPSKDQPTHAPRNNPSYNSNSLIGDSRNFGHRFHANVLVALDEPSNPVHAILGQGETRDYIGIAKEFRNRWKDAEDGSSSRAMPGLRRYERMLNELKLEEMLASILTALGNAQEIVERECQGLSVRVPMELDVDVNVTPWEAMPDAMELDEG